MKFNQTLMTFVEHNLKVNAIPMLVGEPGIGKSSWVIDLARRLRTECFVLACNQLADKADLTGARLVPIMKSVEHEDGSTSEVIDDYKQQFYPHQVISDAIRYAEDNPRETPILFLDEINRTTPDVTSAVLSLSTTRQIGSKNLPKNLRIIIAGNDKGNVTSLDTASISRFVIYDVEPDVGTFLSLDPDLNPFVKAVLTAHPEVLFGKTVHIVKQTDDNDDDFDIEDILDDGEEMSQITTPRTISSISAWLNTFTNDELMQFLSETYTVNGETVSALDQALTAHVGHTNFKAYLYNEIANGILNINSQANVSTLVKPNVYDDMKSQQNIDDLNDFISDMTDNERSGCLLYALYEKEDNKVFIHALSSQTATLIKTDMNTLMKLMANDELDHDNIIAFTKSGSPLAKNLEYILTS